eukprot:jgi/Mesvir1/5183/Mv15318-RA.1
MSGVCQNDKVGSEGLAGRDGKVTQNRLSAYGPFGELCKQVAAEGKVREIVTEYIRPPLLVEGRKFHLRVYVGVVSFEPLTVFFHPGYVKFGQRAYDDSAENASDPYRHFTNIPNPLSYEANVLWAYDELDWYLSAVARRVAPGYVNATLMPLLKRVAVFSMRLLHAVVPAGHEGRFYHEYSLDFFLDDLLRVYLLEINARTGTQLVDMAFFKAFINAVEDLRIAMERGVWPSEVNGGATLPEGMDVGPMELIILKDWDSGTLEGCD